MKKAYFIIGLSMFLITAFCTSCFAGWLIYHKPAFRGRIIDAETKKPIEGAVVVAKYVNVNLKLTHRDNPKLTHPCVEVKYPTTCAGAVF